MIDVDAARHWAGAYVHIPFCAAICPYCDFAVVEGEGDKAGRYVQALLADIEAEEPWRPLEAVFVGGGTPSSIEPAHLGRVLEALEKRFGIAEGAEVTLEANPEDWTLAGAEALVEAGFTRVSFGVQSMDADILAYLGRRHGSGDTVRAVTDARRGGFGSVSVDLIFGAPVESLGSWRSTVHEALALDVDHVSTYALTVEAGTELFRSVRAGAAGPDADDQADKYDLAVEAMAAAGFNHYEISNHARPGHECRYNLTAWAHGEYLAFGMGAHGHRRRTRTWRVRRLDTYLERIENGRSPVQGSEQLSMGDYERERIMIGLRRLDGVEAGRVGEQWAATGEGRELIRAGLVELVGGRLVIRRPLLADAVARSILEARSVPEGS